MVSTLTAALADDDVADQLRTGTLVKPARWEGFGFGGGPDLMVVPATSGRTRGCETRCQEGCFQSNTRRPVGIAR